MTVKEIVEKYLKENGYDGLCGDACGCSADSLMLCGERCDDCEAGYEAPCPGGEYDFYIVSSKEDAEKLKKESEKTKC